MKAQGEVVELLAKRPLLFVAQKTGYVYNDGSAERTF